MSSPITSPMPSASPPRPAAVRVSQVATVVLWAAGSAYLVAHALTAPAVDWVTIGIVPLLWAASITAPIVAHHCWHDGQRLAAVMLVAAGLVGAAWSLAGTISRQSAGDDARMAEQARVTDRRTEVSRLLAEARQILRTHQATQATECASGRGKRCDGVSYTVATWTAAVKGHEAELATLAPPPADAGVRRIAAFVALLPGVSTPAKGLEASVALVLPALLGLFLDVAALAFGFHGFGPSRNRTVRTFARPESPAPEADVRIVREPDRETASPRAERTVRGPAQRRPDGPATKSGRIDRETALAELLTELALGRSVPSQVTLARRWQRPETTVSDWLKAWERDRLIPRRQATGRVKSMVAAGKSA